MKERPILFNADMVRAILSGRKTQTRRVVKPQPIWVYDCSVPVLTTDAEPKGEIKCPYGVPSDRLWVRETWSHTGQGIWAVGDVRYTNDGHFVYRADGEIKGGWFPSLHMPRWASRITLEIVSVRVERLQDIGEEDAEKEGIRSAYVNAAPPLHSEIRYIAPGVRMTDVHGEVDDDAPAHRTAKNAFSCLWDSIYAKRGFGWDANPYVWVIEFRRIENA